MVTTLFPGDSMPEITLEKLPSTAAEIVRQAVAATGPVREADRAWAILDGRFALQSKRLTLQEIADAFGVTRERIRQVEAQTLKRVRPILTATSATDPVNVAIRSDLVAALVKLDALVPKAPGFIAESTLLELIGLKPGDGDFDAVEFLLEVRGAARMTFGDERLPAVWHRLEPAAAKRIRELVGRTHALLTRDAMDPMTPLDLATELNRRKGGRVTYEEMRAAVSWTPSLDTLSDGRLQASFAWIEGRGNQAYRLIREAGRPVDARELAKQINAQIPGPPLSRVNLVNQMLHDERIVPIGRGGSWGLRDRDADVAHTIIDLATDVLRKSGIPLKASDIAKEVSRYRPIDVALMTSFLYQTRFVQLDDRSWALPEWPEARGAVRSRLGQPVSKRDRWSPVRDAVAQNTRSLLIQHPEHRMEYGSLVSVIEAALKRPRPTIYSYVSGLDFVEKNVDPATGTIWVSLKDSSVSES